ncbi:hypothetical protein RN001_008332 [Aquatica leii]|uniref:Uncharacterized protein n=1 Tax=Aquatica leii TaxID=1421715 RepID=A0AAN7S9L1_9COLE|nr:hypothetical protein RN001_008332 [Aquatica leii]
MNRSFEKKKESGAAGRKRRSLEAKEKETTSKVFKTFFQKSSTSTTSSDNPENSASARPQELEDTGSNSSKKELVAASIDGDAENFSYNSKILATSEETEVGSEFDKEMKIDDVEDKDLIFENVQIIKCPIPKIIEEHDIGFLMFSEETGKAIITDPLRIEIINHGFKHFQNIEGPFLPTNNRSMYKSWFFKKFENGHDEQVMRSWLVYRLPALPLIFYVIDRRHLCFQYPCKLLHILLRSFISANALVKGVGIQLQIQR